MFATVNGYIKISLRILQLFAFNAYYKGDDKPSIFKYNVDNIEPWFWWVARNNLVFLVLSIPLYWGILLLIESRALSCLFRKAINNVGGVERETYQAHYGVDEDIVEEDNRVMAMSKEENPVRMYQVKKHFGNVHAVKNISFGLEFGECFALLGVSGAGKTTLFKCLTGELYPSSGELTINGYDITTPSGFH